MSERHFDYTAMQEAYQGLETEFSNIADVLDGIDKQYRDAVNVSEEAIFGDLGSQLLLDWDNASSNFPGFMQNFENWSAVVAASGGNYAQFENDIAGFKSVDNGSYLGVSAQQNGITTNYVEGSNIRDYANSIAGQYENDMQSLKALYELTGAEYAVANSQSILKRHKIVTGIAIGCEAVGLAFLALPVIGKIFGTAAAGTAAAGTAAAGTTAAGGAAGTAATGAAKSSALKTIFGNIGRGIKGTATKVGNVKIGGKTIAQTTFGQHVAQGGIKGVAKQTLGTIAVFETGEIVGEAKGGH